jgi:hypothetical protein
MDCNICLETHQLYYLCDRCNTGICKKCIKNLEKYRMRKCPYCRNICDLDIKYNYFKRVRYILYTLIGLFIFIYCQAIIPCYLLINHSKLNKTDKTISIYLILFCFMFLQQSTVILAIYGNIIPINRIAILLCYVYYFIVNTLFLIIISYYKINLIFLVCYYLFAIYFIPLLLVCFLVYFKFFKYCFDYLRLIYYKKTKLKILGEINFVNEPLIAVASL